MIIDDCKGRLTDSMQEQLENLNRMCRYCSDVVSCRRALPAGYFGEIFDRRKCSKDQICDNCEAATNSVKRDMTEVATTVIELVRRFGRRCYTMRQLQVFVQSKKGKSKIQKENPAIPRPGALHTLHVIRV